MTNVQSVVLGEAIVVGPDDQLIISLPRDVTLKEMDEVSVLLRQRFGDRVTVIAGVEQMALLKPAFPDHDPVERGPAHDPPPGLS
jgi:hypothetical protein